MVSPPVPSPRCCSTLHSITPACARRSQPSPRCRRMSRRPERAGSSEGRKRMAGIGATSFAADELLLVPGQTMLGDGPVAGHAVVIANGVFREVGPAPKLVAKYPGLTPVELPGMLLMPGFIDAHHHLTQSFGKALAF